MLTGDRIMGFVREQADMGHSVNQTLGAMGFHPEDNVDSLQAICATATMVGLLNLSFREVPVEVPAENAVGVACALEALLIGLAAGYALGLRDQETPFDA
jgi:hypothetical protein